MRDADHACSFLLSDQALAKLLYNGMYFVVLCCRCSGQRLSIQAMPVSERTSHPHKRRSTMVQGEQARKWQQITAKARCEAGFKKKLLAEPAAVLSEGGVEIPPDVEVRMLEKTDKAWYFVLPPVLPYEVPDVDLEKVAAGQSPTSTPVCPCSRSC
jgi:hypothetical protein